MKTIATALAVLLLLCVASPAQAQLRHVEMKTLGMD
jgi:hypothetical protein